MAGLWGALLAVTWSFASSGRQVPDVGFASRREEGAGQVVAAGERVAARDAEGELLARQRVREVRAEGQHLPGQARELKPRRHAG